MSPCAILSPLTLSHSLHQGPPRDSLLGASHGAGGLCKGSEGVMGEGVPRDTVHFPLLTLHRMPKNMHKDLKRGISAPQKAPSHRVGWDGKGLKSKLGVLGKKKSSIFGVIFTREEPGAHQAEDALGRGADGGSGADGSQARNISIAHDLEFPPHSAASQLLGRWPVPSSTCPRTKVPVSR